MKRSLSGPELSAAARDAVKRVLPWVRGTAPRPSRPAVAEAVRLSAEVLAQVAPGNTVEVRVPPFVAVQCVAGPQHRRGTPPNVVQCDPHEWLRLVVGDVDLSSSDADISGTRAGAIGESLPLFRFGSSAG
ncbi:hypothetical protein CFAL_02240 [Corynebacterium falsenii DSM 44353]|uniref:sterol carrier family protein n=1 Tax=Corynebacterium falsenii TaxID=108486 RepID=UPI0003E922A0|nr:sterol carrier family protein [Corynebacterium falsenii]AHI02571.1 hypothetical protein CFAL_02240 [Corynebacterium falsenii DSM 44353]MDC7104115.1 sterol carrier family protein [Corynebacterium falsenii]UBI05353.1 sterol carrier family protein [Corynebacterium falsenii]